jgi:hypothetical protein
MAGSITHFHKDTQAATTAYITKPHTEPEENKKRLQENNFPKAQASTFQQIL